MGYASPRRLNATLANERLAAPDGKPLSTAEYLGHGAQEANIDGIGLQHALRSRLGELIAIIIECVLL